MLLNRTQVAENDANAMKNALQETILSVGIDGGSFAFQTYTGGILSDPNCYHRIDHAVNVVGWGIDESSSQEYWIVKNQWGTDWGDQGYAYIEIVSGVGICGIQADVNFPFTKV